MRLGFRTFTFRLQVSEFFLREKVDIHEPNTLFIYNSSDRGIGDFLSTSTNYYIFISIFFYYHQTIEIKCNETKLLKKKSTHLLLSQNN